MIPAFEYGPHRKDDFRTEKLAAVRGSAVFKITVEQNRSRGDVVDHRAQVKVYYRDSSESDGYGVATSALLDEFTAEALYNDYLKQYHFIEEDDDNA